MLIDDRAWINPPGPLMHHWTTRLQQKHSGGNQRRLSGAWDCLGMVKSLADLCQAEPREFMAITWWRQRTATVQTPLPPPTRPLPPPQPSHLRIRRTLTYRYLQCWSDMFVSLRLTPPPPNPVGGLEHTRKTHTWPGTCSGGIRPNGDEVKREVREVREVTSSPPGLESSLQVRVSKFFLRHETCRRWVRGGHTRSHLPVRSVLRLHALSHW